MNKKTIITMMLALICMIGQAQTTKTVTITGCSPALKDSTLVVAGTGLSLSVVVFLPYDEA